MDGTSFYPDVSNTATSGLSSRRWANTYSVLGDFIGRITGTAGITIDSATNPGNTFNEQSGSGGTVANIFQRYGSGHSIAGGLLEARHLGGVIGTPTTPVAGTLINSLNFRTGGTNAAFSTNPSFSIRHTIGVVGATYSEVDTDFMVTSTSSGVPRTALTLRGNSDAAIFPGTLTANGNIAFGNTVYRTDGSTGLGTSSAANVWLAIGGTQIIGSGNVNEVTIRQASALGFSNTSANTVSGYDVNFNRSAAGTIQVGTTAANALGSLNLTNLTASGLATINGTNTASRLSLIHI